MKRYAIYGDDDQQRLNEIFNEEENIYHLVDLANKKTMKQRKKTSDKKKSLDTSVNDTHPGEVKDVEPLPPINKKDTDKKSFEKKKEKKQKEEVETKKSKKSIVFIFILIALLICGGVVYSMFGDTISTFTSQILEKVTGKSDEKQISEMDIGYHDPSSQIGDIEEGKGLLDEAAEKEYTLKDILSAASQANAALGSYYSRLQEIAEVSKKEDVSSLTATIKAGIEEDKRIFTSYEERFNKFEGGKQYYDSLYSRFVNVGDLMTSIEFIDNSKLYNFINLSIDEENKLISQGKNELINFLEVNGVEYTDKGTSIEFVLN